MVCARTGSKMGISPLMLAAMNGHTAAVKLLLDMGSDVNAQVLLTHSAPNLFNNNNNNNNYQRQCLWCYPHDHGHCESSPVFL